MLNINTYDMIRLLRIYFKNPAIYSLKNDEISAKILLVCVEGPIGVIEIEFKTVILLFSRN